MISYLRFLSGRERTEAADRHLALTLAFVAGAVNAGGFMLVLRYTSHMTGILSAAADELALGDARAAAAGLSFLLSFAAGAAVCAILVNWARRGGRRAQYALPLLLEAALLLGAAAAWRRGAKSSLAAPLLCFLMGLQNAIITKISGARMRTTHVTGILTDLGIELGKLLYWNMGAEPKVTADRGKAGLLASLLVSFFAGGVAGGWGFARAGFLAAAPLGLLLLAIAVVPVLDDLFG